MRTTSSPLQEIGNFFRKRSALSNIIAINVIIYLLINIIELGFFLFEASPNFLVNSFPFPVYWLSVPADLHQLIIRPWGIFTYMFVHQELMHLIFNMVTFFFCGRIFLSLLNEKKLVSTYIIGGLSGGVFFMLAYNIFPVFSSSLVSALAIGASASVLAVLIAAATLSPNFEVQFFLIVRLKLKYIALALVVLDIMSISRDNPGGHIAHLGGAAWGYFYIRYFLDKGLNSLKLRHPWRSIFNKKPFQKTYVNRKAFSDEEYNEQKNLRQKQIDLILDKISKQGYDGLSKEEKEILFKSQKK